MGQRAVLAVALRILGGLAIIIGIALSYVSLTLTTSSLGGELFNLLIGLAFVAGGIVLVVWG